VVLGSWALRGPVGRRRPGRRLRIRPFKHLCLFSPPSFRARLLATRLLVCNTRREQQVPGLMKRGRTRTSNARTAHDSPTGVHSRGSSHFRPSVHEYGRHGRLGVVVFPLGSKFRPGDQKPKQRSHRDLAWGGPESARNTPRRGNASRAYFVCKRRYARCCLQACSVVDRARC
jgi:hypothetical protein